MLPRFLPAGILPIVAAIAGDAQLSASNGTTAAEVDAAAFMPLEKVETPIFGNSRIEGRLNATLVLQMASPAEAGRIAKRVPELRTRIVETMLDYGSLYVSGFAPVDAEALSAALNAEVRKHNPGVQRVLIVALSASPL